jgi:hypoxia up-regulated 1
MMMKTSTTTSLVWVAAGLISCVSAKAILGVDLGSLYMKVALVQRGAPLEIVTNLHSKRKTEQMILFDQGSRFYGADAFSLISRKPKKTPSAFTVMLGRDEDHPAVTVSSWAQ